MLQNLSVTHCRNLFAVFFLTLTACSGSGKLPPTPSVIVASANPDARDFVPNPATEPPSIVLTQVLSPIETEIISPTQALMPTATLVQVTVTDESGGPVHGIILFIGDGLGVYQRMGTQWLNLGEETELAMDAMPVLGFQETAAANRTITDSAAAATALSTGQRTNYGAIGVGIDGSPLSTILEQAQAQGRSVGLVTTVQLAHATPAAFAAHVSDRDYMLEIARQMMAAEVDVLLGGGEDDFLPGDENGCYPEPGHRRDGLNLIADARAKGYTHVCTAEQLAAVDTATVDRLIGFFGDEELKEPFAPSLSQMTQVAIEILSKNPNGFFLMVEAGQIDWAGHDNDAEKVMRTTMGLDAAVVQAQIYALGNPDTLIIVTGDHEIGGMTLNLDGSGGFRQDGPYSMPSGVPFYIDWIHGSHTAANVPVTAQGPYSEFLYGTYPNTFIFDVMGLALYGVGR